MSSPLGAATAPWPPAGTVLQLSRKAKFPAMVLLRGETPTLYAVTYEPSSVPSSMALLDPEAAGLAPGAHVAYRSVKPEPEDFEAPVLGALEGSELSAVSAPTKAVPSEFRGGELVSLGAGVHLVVHCVPGAGGQELILLRVLRAPSGTEGTYSVARASAPGVMEDEVLLTREVLRVPAWRPPALLGWVSAATLKTAQLTALDALAPALHLGAPTPAAEAARGTRHQSGEVCALQGSTRPQLVLSESHEGVAVLALHRADELGSLSESERSGGGWLDEEKTLWAAPGRPQLVMANKLGPAITRVEASAFGVVGGSTAELVRARGSEIWDESASLLTVWVLNASLAGQYFPAVVVGSWRDGGATHLRVRRIGPGERPPRSGGVTLSDTELDFGAPSMVVSGRDLMLRPYATVVVGGSLGAKDSRAVRLLDDEPGDVPPMLVEEGEVYLAESGDRRKTLYLAVTKYEPRLKGWPTVTGVRIDTPGYRVKGASLGTWLDGLPADAQLLYGSAVTIPVCRLGSHLGSLSPDDTELARELASFPVPKAQIVPSAVLWMQMPGESARGPRPAVVLGSSEDGIEVVYLTASPHRHQEAGHELLDYEAAGLSREGKVRPRTQYLPWSCVKSYAGTLSERDWKGVRSIIQRPR